MSIIHADTPVFSNLRSRSSVDDAEFGGDDDIGDGRVFCRITESLSNQALPGNDVVDLQSCTLFGKVLHCGLSVILVLEENKSDII